MTWGRELTDYPATDPAHSERSDVGVNGQAHYTEGLLVGYRWFDAKQIEPCFPLATASPTRALNIPT
jgi:beta-glucosidase